MRSHRANLDVKMNMQNAFLEITIVLASLATLLGGGVRLNAKTWGGHQLNTCYVKSNPNVSPT